MEQTLVARMEATIMIMYVLRVLLMNDFVHVRDPVECYLFSEGNL